MKLIPKPTMTKSISIITFLFFLFLIIKKDINAQSFTSTSYQIQFGNFNMTSGKKTSANYSLTDTVGQNAPGQFDSNGYVLKSGFQYIYDTINQFSFKIDNLAINFGSLVPNIGSTATNNITITTPSGHGYEIITTENHPLLNNGIIIPDTTCNVSTTCTESTSGVWDTNSVYGFGFKAVGINSSNVATGVGTSNIFPFPDQNYYRQFANSATQETGQILMTESKPVKEHSSRITYKINISANQAAGEYENSISFIAIPKY